MAGGTKVCRVDKSVAGAQTPGGGTISPRRAGESAANRSTPRPSYPCDVYFVGVDLAWGVRNPTGVAVVDPEGRLVHVQAAHDDADVLEKLRPYVRDDCLVAFDAPLVVTNPTGQRPAEQAFNRDFRRFEAGAHPTNTGKPEFAGGPRAARLARALKLDMSPRSRRTRRAIEVYPHPATVALFRLPRTLKYKAKPGRGLARLKKELLLLMDGLEGLAVAAVPLRVAGLEWAELRRQAETAEFKSELRRVEDPVDAVVCAYVALYAERRPDDITIYGDLATGCIVTPTLPTDLVAAPPSDLHDVAVERCEHVDDLDQRRSRGRPRPRRVVGEGADDSTVDRADQTRDQFEPH